MITDDLGLIASSGATVAHCPVAYFRRGLQMDSISKYHEHGVNVAMGTDQCPRDIVREIGAASQMAKILEGTPVRGTAHEVFDAATIGGAKALNRTDLGRLEAGALADIVTIRLDGLHMGAVWDPVQSIVECATGADVDNVMVDGDLVIRGGHHVAVEETALLDQINEEAQKYYRSVKNWHYTRAEAKVVFPRALPTRD